MKIPNKPVVIEVNGAPLGRFDSVSDAAVFFNRVESTITYRIAKKEPFNGILYRYATESDITLRNLTLPKSKQKSGPKPIKPKVVKEQEPSIEKPDKDDDIELDRERYTIIPYQTRYERLCITPCPFITGNERPFVGSTRCASCKSFRGRNRKTQEIACKKRN